MTEDPEEQRSINLLALNTLILLTATVLSFMSPELAIYAVVANAMGVVSIFCSYFFGGHHTVTDLYRIYLVIHFIEGLINIPRMAGS